MDEKLRTIVKQMALASGDPINFMYELEQVLLELTENWDWIDEKEGDEYGTKVVS